MERDIRTWLYGAISALFLGSTACAYGVGDIFFATFNGFAAGWFAARAVHFWEA